MAAPRIDGSRTAPLLDAQANEAPRPLPWAHTAVNRGLAEQRDPKAAYELVAAPIGLWETLSYKSPSTGEFVQVTPSGGGVSAHEMAGQYAGALFDKALAERKAKRP